jgi:hypothetical protein
MLILVDGRFTTLSGGSGLQKADAQRLKLTGAPH